MMETFDAMLRVAVFGVGFLGLIVFFRSILRVAVLNRRQRDSITIRVGNAVRVAVMCLARRRRDYGDVQKTMGWAFPIFIFSLTAVWFFLVLISFALMIWAVEADKNWLKAFIASGSALSTLGFATPLSVAGQLFGIVEGAIGLGIVVFMFTFIPGYRSAVQAREEMVGWLYARVGAHPTPFSLVEWCQIAGQSEDMTPIWTSGESWFRGLLETHSLTPLLAFVPSVYRGRTWVGAAAAMLDAASFVLSSLNVKGLESARLCHQTGVEALRLIARELPGPMKGDATANRDLDELASGYEAAYERLAAAGQSMKHNRDECRRTFLTLRSQYEGFVRGIAAATLMPVEEPWVLPQAKTTP